MLAMKAGESVTDYFTGTMTNSNEMCSYGESMDCMKIMEKIL